MQEQPFKEYLSRRFEKESTVSTYLSDARAAENGLGEDLDVYLEKDIDRPLPGSVKPWLGTAVNHYRDFLRDGKEDETGDFLSGVTTSGGDRFSLEADLQRSLRDNLGQLSPELAVADGNSERTTAAGRMDILARGSDGTLWVIELKAGRADEKAVGQLAAYMGALAEEEPEDIRGLLVAREFTEKARYALRAIQAISLKCYGFSFTFEDIS